jgi:hypothetical protein
MDNLKTFGNVNILNLVAATEASVAGIRCIENLNVAIYTAETQHLLNQLNPKNINMTVEVPAGANLVTKVGVMQINSDFFKNAGQKIFFLVTGQLIVEPGIPVAEIENGLAGILVTGQFFCPEDRMGSFNARQNTIIGEAIAYPPFKYFVKGDLDLDLAFLNSLADGTEICVIGDLSVPKVLPNELLEQKIGQIFVSAAVECHAENAQVLRAKLYKQPNDFETIPAGYEWVRKPLLLDGATLEYLPGKNLFCKELVQIAADVDPAMFDQRVDSLIAKDLLLCPAALKPVVARKCSLFDTKAIFYTGELWLVQDEQTWQTWRFDALKGAATLVVTGELSIDPAIPSAILSERLAKIHNFGLIRCAPEQQAAIEARLATREGEIEEISNESAPVEEVRPDYIGNVNILTL